MEKDYTLITKRKKYAEDITPTISLVGFIAQTKGLGLKNAMGLATILALGFKLGSMAIYFVVL